MKTVTSIFKHSLILKWCWIYSTKLPIKKNVLRETVHFWQPRKIGPWPINSVLDCAINGVLLNFSGKYIYTESSGRRPNDTARYVSPQMTIDNTGSCIKFWYSMYGSDINRLNLYAMMSESKTILSFFCNFGEGDCIFINVLSVKHKQNWFHENNVSNKILNLTSLEWFVRW